MTVSKLFILFKSGQSVGAYTVASIAKTYVLFGYGCGSSLPFVFELLNLTKSSHQALVIALLVLNNIAALSVSFLAFFEKDRTEQLLAWGLSLIPTPEAVLEFDVYSAASGLLILVVILMIACIKKRMSKEAPENQDAETEEQDAVEESENDRN